ncbi:MAG: DUF58 domain-containing protein [Flavobacteriaceae bacterium]|nr:DUF58 domain-containing protein [Flavobacteriaceae bacterium]MDG1041716.1 DUF58 domain-containing protein [Flavobacteriaceae bacterium]
MDIQKELQQASGFLNFDLLAKSIVEGFISGLHKSPFHGFSAEFAEHKIYNNGESTRHIDWKLFAKTDKLYTKRYDEETNLRCHLIVDNSSSMHYPKLKNHSIDSLNKVGFSTLAAAAMMQLLKKQRDAVGLSIYSETLDYYAPEKGSERHHQMLMDNLNTTLNSAQKAVGTKTYEVLHQIAEKLHRRSLIFLFTDMLQPDQEAEQLFEALRHLNHNKHELVLFHIYDKATEFNFKFDNTPRRFMDVETGGAVDLYPESLQANYETAVARYFKDLRMKCGQYKINYVGVDIQDGFDKILTTYMVERQKFR